MNNDRFKFRVWDNENNEYLDEAYPSSIYSDGSLYAFEEKYDANSEMVALFEIPNNCLIVEQCTGRKDKNGRLIFEGDVVKTIWEERFDWTRLVKHVEHLFEVYYNGMGLSLRDLKTKAGHVMWKSEDYEVIGNIHEVE